MNYLFFTNTPAHVHLYKHAVASLRNHGHEPLVLARDYGCTIDLLDRYGLPYEVYGRCGVTKRSLLRNLPRQYVNIALKTRRFDPDLIFGMGAYAAHAGALSRTPTILILDSEPTSLDHAISRPFAEAIVTPRAFTKDLGSNHYVFDGFKECAYLHPDVYRSVPGTRERLGLEPGEPYAIVRFNAFGSHHDVGHGGFTPRRRRALVERLAEYATVFVSDESGEMRLDRLPARPFSTHPAHLHDALAGADLLVADTQTMVTEAALLGTPAIRSNSFVGNGDMGNFVELEAHGLVHNVAEFGDVMDTALDIVRDPDAKGRLRKRRDAYLSDKVNLTDVILDVARTPDRLEEVADLQQR